ncbi:MAG: hypothetical protein K0R27_116 [Xanthobacteraceae bacterium]|nr:hypothetical protein [Xanthobacteraceae bacterium]
MPIATPSAAPIAARNTSTPPPNINRPMTLSLPPWLSACLAAMTGHPPRIPAALALTSEQRQAIACCLEELDERLAPATEREVGARFAALLLAFPAQPSSEAAAKVRAGAYFEALAGEPAWAIARACRRWLRGEVEGVLASANLAFAPSPPQLRRLVEAETLPVRHQAARLDKLLRAEPEGGAALSGERRAAMAARLKALSRSLA